MSAIERHEILDLLVERLAAVLAVEAGELDEDTRFDEDLHADSLDLVEVIEGVEQALAARGAAVTMSDEELVTLATVGEAADRLAALTETTA